MKLPLPRQEQEILLCHAYNITLSELYAHPARYHDQDTRYTTLYERRLKQEPIAYIVGYQPFMCLIFFVDRSVLIPRPETELLAQMAIDLKPKVIADIGTGSGAIAVTLAKTLPETKVIAIDSSSDALKIAKKNAEYHRVTDRCHFLAGHLLDLLPEKVDLIVSNPPYIPTREIDKLEPQIKDFEPREALDGGKDGLHYIRQLIENSPKYLSPKGHLLMEFGFGQAEEIKDLAQKHFKTIEIYKDLAGIDRILKAWNT
ncbi:peptide chain release factor N(5)-glutamine methyltransferase [Candidatus Saganbacteria bacterium]|nr:peptide chain release factor N(5)-glutamine methyltransferase [Candidatus Saganbacteria bacterium]